MRINSIVYSTAADGEGLRNTLYVQGCTHRCPGCHNPHTWDPRGGCERPVNEVAELLCANNNLDITISGGDPFDQASELLKLVGIIKNKYLRNIWVYTGYTYEYIKSRYCLDDIDVIVDGPYKEELRNTTLRFRGSENQRIIKIPKKIH